MTQYKGTRKDWAVEHGFAKPGKGRMSREAHAALEKVIAEGMTFTDYRVAVRASGTSKGSEEAPKVIGPNEEANVYADAFMRYELDQQFTYNVDGKAHVINGRGVCRECGYSLVGHTCNTPVVLTQHGWQAVKPKGE